MEGIDNQVRVLQPAARDQKESDQKENVEPKSRILKNLRFAPPNRLFAILLDFLVENSKIAVSDIKIVGDSSKMEFPTQAARGGRGQEAAKGERRTH